jgi:hypothetical protein
MKPLKSFAVSHDKLNSICDIQIDAKVEAIVMIFANAAGRKVVEDLWPEVEWSSDEKFADSLPSDWLFTHVRVTKLPPDLEKSVPLAFAEPDALGFAVALALQQYSTKPRSVGHWVGHGNDMHLRFYNTRHDQSIARSTFVEYIAPGVPVSL